VRRPRMIRRKAELQATRQVSGKNIFQPHRDAASVPRKKPLPRKYAFFGLHFDLHPRKDDTQLGEHLTEDMVTNLLEKVKPDYVQYDCKGHAGYAGYPTKVGFPSPGIVKDSLAIWRKATRKFGVGLYVHYSGVWDSAAIENHPDWARIDADGNPDKDSTSTFGPYCERLLIPQLKEAIDAYDLDGVWVDGDCWAVKPDFSPTAVEAFTQATGIEAIPRKAGDPHWKEFLEFQREAFRQYVRRYVQALHQHKPGFQVASNWMFSSFAPEPITIPVDYISGDYSAGDSVNTARLEARYMASTGMPWDLMAWGFNRGRDSGWSLKTAIQLKQEASVVLSQGGGFQIYYNPTRAGWIDGWMIKIMAEVARFCRERQAFSHRTRTVPQVALLLSETSIHDKTDRLFGGWGDLTRPVEGMLHALLELHYSVDIQAEHQLAAALGRYPLIVIPECHLIPDDLREALIRRAQRGGSLLLVGAEAARAFGDVLGVKMAGEPANAQAMYLQGGDDLAWLGGTWQEVEPTTAQWVGRAYRSSDTRQDPSCAATVGRLGKGMVGAIYGPFGTVFRGFHNPVARRFLGDIMKRLFPRPALTVEAPPCVDVALRKKRGDLLVQMVNASGMQVASDYPIIDYIPPVSNLVIELAIGKRPSRVCLEPGHESVRANWSRGRLRVRVRSLDIHSILVVST